MKELKRAPEAPAETETQRVNRVLDEFNNKVKHLVTSLVSNDYHRERFKCPQCGTNLTLRAQIWIDSSTNELPGTTTALYRAILLGSARVSWINPLSIIQFCASCGFKNKPNKIEYEEVSVKNNPDQMNN